jgi:DNA processing protein
VSGDVLSPNTQAVLLLTASLPGAGEALSASEYSGLAVMLRAGGRQPADLLTHEAEVLAACDGIDGERVRRLLARGFALSQALERWRSRAIWVVSRADASYPRRLKARLGQAAPPLLYGVGDVALLARGGLAIVGSRAAHDDALAFAQATAGLCARGDHGVVSGGARGVDQAAQRGALDAGGQVVSVLADGLERAAMQRDHRAPLIEGALVLVSPYDPGAGFDVGHAMQRNKLIYALANAALVVASERDKGGTWAGAIEQLDVLRSVRVYVRSSSSPGLTALRERGAERWPDLTHDPFEQLDALLAQGGP